jgi:hypothetical protein
MASIGTYQMSGNITDQAPARSRCLCSNGRCNLRAPSFVRSGPQSHSPRLACFGPGPAAFFNNIIGCRSVAPFLFAFSLGQSGMIRHHADTVEHVKVSIAAQRFDFDEARVEVAVFANRVQICVVVWWWRGPVTTTISALRIEIKTTTYSLPTEGSLMPR